MFNYRGRGFCSRTLTFQNVCFYFCESPLKVINNAFYFMWKAPFVLEIFTFLSWLFGFGEKRFDRRAMILKFRTSQTGQQIIAVHILPNISWTKGNKAMKFGQLVECNMINIFHEKSYTKCGGEASPRFHEK